MGTLYKIYVTKHNGHTVRMNYASLARFSSNPSWMVQIYLNIYGRTHIVEGFGHNKFEAYRNTINEMVQYEKDLFNTEV